MKTLLVANRGEIALRVIRACTEMGLSTVAVYSSADRGAPHARAADRAIELPGCLPADTYGNAEKLVEVARTTGAEAVHPGYGFLAENADFARLVTEAGLAFVGPRAETLELLGDKVASARVAREQDVPFIEKSETLEGLAAARSAANALGYPVLVKSPYGGGGLGCHIARDDGELPDAFSKASSQGTTLYGSADVFVERFVARARHIEVQTLGDGDGNVVHVGTRECSLQRRRQKVIEEAPAQRLSPNLRHSLHEAALRLVGALRLRSAATVEFLVEGDDFYFLEVNPRIQVEHPVTEAVFGVDLVRRQLAIAAGEGVGVASDLKPRGYACEARIYAEDPVTFAPSPGRIVWFRPPSGPGIRIDTGVEEGSAVTALYDPLIAKLIAWDDGKQRAVARLARALRSFGINGDLRTNIPLLAAAVEADWFASGDYHTTTLEEWSFEPTPTDEAATVAARMAALLDETRRPSPVTPSWWRRPTWKEEL